MSLNVVIMGVELVLVLLTTKNLSFRYKGKGNRAITIIIIIVATTRKRRRNVIDSANAIREKSYGIVIVQVVNCELCCWILFSFFFFQLYFANISSSSVVLYIKTGETPLEFVLSLNSSNFQTL